MLFVIMIAAAAGATDPAPPAVSATTPAAKPKKERIICVEEQFVGSNITRRVCKTKSQWDLVNEGAQDAVRRSGDRATVRQLPGTPNGSGG